MIKLFLEICSMCQISIIQSYLTCRELLFNSYDKFFMEWLYKENFWYISSTKIHFFPGSKWSDDLMLSYLLFLERYERQNHYNKCCVQVFWIGRDKSIFLRGKQMSFQSANPDCLPYPYYWQQWATATSHMDRRTKKESVGQKGQGLLSCIS